MLAEIAFGTVLSILVVSGVVAVASSASPGNERRFRELVRDPLQRAGLDLLELRKPGWLETGTGQWWNADGTRLENEPVIRYGHHGHHHHDHVIIRLAEVRTHEGTVHEVRVRIRPDDAQVAFGLPLDRVGE